MRIKQRDLKFFLLCLKKICMLSNMMSDLRNFSKPVYCVCNFEFELFSRVVRGVKPEVNEHLAVIRIFCIPFHNAQECVTEHFL